MTYKIEPRLGRITSPITLLFPTGVKPPLEEKDKQERTR